MSDGEKLDRRQFLRGSAITADAKFAILGSCV